VAVTPKQMNVILPAVPIAVTERVKHLISAQLAQYSQLKDVVANVRKVRVSVYPTLNLNLNNLFVLVSVVLKYQTKD